MASNVEGEALKRMSGASAKPGGVSNVVKAMVADKWLRGGRDSGGGSGKTAADWENEEIAKQHEFGRQGTRRDWAQADSANPRYKQVNYSSDGSVGTGFYPASTPRQKPAANAKSGGGQGTSGNKRGSQFKNTVGEVAKDVVSTGVGTLAGAAVGAVTKNPKAATAAGTLATEGTKAVIDKVSKRRAGKASSSGNELNEVSGPVNPKGNTGGASPAKSAAAKKTVL